MKYELVILCSGCLRPGDAVPLRHPGAKLTLRQSVLARGWRFTGSDMWCPDCYPTWRTVGNRTVRHMLTWVGELRRMQGEVSEAKAAVEDYRKDLQAMSMPPFLERPTPEEVESLTPDDR